MIRSESVGCLALTAGVIAQSVLLWVRSEMGPRESMELWAAAVGIAIATVELWRWRRFLNPHIDMLLIMFSIGGAAMAFGLPVGMSCHAAGWTEWLWMSSSMIAAGLLPGAYFSRCLQEARRAKQLCSTMALDSPGMLGGMKVAGLISTAPSGAWGTIASHMLMVIGMMAGMIAAMALRRSGAWKLAAMTNVAEQVTPVPLRFLARVFRLRVWNPHI